MIDFIRKNRVYQSEFMKKIRRLKFFRMIKFILLSNMQLPDFLIIGCMKCGTSSLFDYLRKNPKIYDDHPKELYFFDIEYSKGLRWYCSHFRRHKVNLEAATHYINSSAAARRIYKLLPNIKLILMLRNPADRTISHYYHNVRKGEWREPLPLVEALEAEGERTKNTDYWNKLIYGYKENSKHLKKLRPWLEYFSLEQILIIKS